MMTLVATAPNLVVHGALVRDGQAGFGFFAFTPFGLPVLALAIGWLLWARRWLAPRPRLSEWIAEYGLAAREHRLRVAHDSPMAGRTLQDLDLRATSGLNLLAIERHERLGHRLVAPTAATRLYPGDILFLDVSREPAGIDALAGRFGLQPLPLSGSYFSDRSQDLGMAEVMVPAHSTLVGRTIVQARFRSIFDLSVIGLKRGPTPTARSSS